MPVVPRAYDQSFFGRSWQEKEGSDDGMYKWLNQAPHHPPLPDMLPDPTGSSLGQRNGNKKFTGPERPPMQKTFVILFRGLGC